MKYLLIKTNGEIKEYERLPRSIKPKDILVDLEAKIQVNNVVKLQSNGHAQKQVVDINSLLKDLKAA